MNFEVGALKEETSNAKQELLHSKLENVAKLRFDEEAISGDIAAHNVEISKLNKEISKLNDEIACLIRRKKQTFDEIDKGLIQLDRLGLIVNKIYIIKGKAFQFYRSHYGKIEMKSFEIEQVSET